MTTDPLQKLRLAAQAVQDARDIYGLKVKARNILIVTALDEGYEQSRVAAVVGLSSPRVMAIAAEFDNDKAQSLTPE